MRHRVYGRKLSRDSEHRRAMIRNLAAGLFEHGQVETTLPKAKAVQPFIEKIITIAKKGTFRAFNRYGEIRKAPRLVQHIMTKIGPLFADRDGGYTRIVKLGRHRLGDGADLVLLQLVGVEEGPEVSGGISGRRRQADRRTAYAAKLRKDAAAKEAEAEKAATAVEESPEPESEAETPETEAEPEAKADE
ncbi:MAG: 50S ribosomal protein L17 [Planctomycetota bacterium]|jgi:large subunit ribosomal protein L17